jgi:aminoglycoside/choline kinase family phosphotransferase
MDQRERDTLLHESRCRVPGWAHAELEMDAITKGGSDRNYCRVTRRNGGEEGPKSVVLMLYTERRPDNRSFFSATEALALSGVRTLRIYDHDAVNLRAWLEDLGEEDLWTVREDGDRRRALYQSTLREAARLHAMRWEDIPEELRANLQKPFDEALYAWEQGYFFDQWAARFSALSAEELLKVREGGEMAALRRELGALPRSPVHRDFQSQNVIIREGEAWLIDYQGLREGRPEYDLASLLYDPYVCLPAEERAVLRDYYFALRGEDHAGCTERILAMCACQRLMQALGAYGKLGAGDGKTAFLHHIRPAVGILREVLRESGLLPSLDAVLTLRDGALEEAGLTEIA